MTDSAGSLFDSLRALMARLRGPDGCPWDRAQTRATLTPYLLEEAYEVLEAIEETDVGGLREELGDLLLQVVFHTQIAEELGEFRMADVLQGLIDKMRHRHPHVFGGTRVDTAGEALAQWERIKREEAPSDGPSRSALDGVPRRLPALLRAQRVQVKAGRVGFDWPDATQALGKVREELEEVRGALDAGSHERVAEEVGDLLFSAVNVARLAGIDAEGALAGAIVKFGHRFRAVEAALAVLGKKPEEVSADELEQAWQAAKAAAQ